LPSDRLFGPSFTTPEMAEAVSDHAWLAALLEFEAALAGAEAAAGLIPAAAAAAISGACDPTSFDLEQLGRHAVASGSPVLPVVAALKAAVPSEVEPFVHFGSTSQDALDTALMLVARRGLDLLLADLEKLVHACARLARDHRQTPMAGRTLMQQAVPISLGLKAANWMTGADEAAEGLAHYRRHRLAVQLGGAAGTRAGLEGKGREVAAGIAGRLDLPDPGLPWHSERSRVAQLGGALAVAAGAAGKIALDILLLAQTEVGEVAVEDSGRSTAMPHKRNPVAAIEADACVRGALAQVAILLASQRVEHERAAGAWQAEWPAVAEAFRLTAGAVDRALAAVEGLRPDEKRMLANLGLGGGFDPGRDAEEQLGEAEAIIDQALAAHRARRHP
jgi:3-carboxy-cis,cis-muconate cycloisomerase